MQRNEQDLHRQQSGRWFVLSAAVLWGTTGAAQALAPDGTQPASVGAVRLAVGGITLLMIAAGRGALRSGKPWPVLALICAAGSMAAYQLCFFAAVATTGVAVGTMVALGSAPILAGLLGWLIRKERPKRRWIVATALAIGGCGILMAASRSLNVDMLGVMLALGAGSAYALFAVVSKQLLEVQSPDAVMAAVFCLGALLLSPLLLIVDLRWVVTARGLAVGLHLGVLATAVAYILFARGLTTLPVATVVTFSLAEPLTAGLLAVVVLGEQLSAMAMIGIGLLFSGLVLLAMSPKDAVGQLRDGQHPVAPRNTS